MSWASSGTGHGMHLARVGISGSDMPTSAIKVGIFGSESPSFPSTIWQLRFGEANLWPKRPLMSAGSRFLASSCVSLLESSSSSWEKTGWWGWLKSNVFLGAFSSDAHSRRMMVTLNISHKTKDDKMAMDHPPLSCRRAFVLRGIMMAHD